MISYETVVLGMEIGTIRNCGVRNGTGLSKIYGVRNGTLLSKIYGVRNGT